MRRALAIWLALAPGLSYAGPSPFRGENCARCHAAIRDRKPAERPGAPDGPPESRQIVIVGAGVSGLAAAYSLQGYDVLLLEKEDRVGGKVAYDDWDGRGYTVAASYMAKPYLDEIKAMFQDLGLTAPVIPRPENAFSSDALARYLDRLSHDMGAFAADARNAIPPVPRAGQVTLLQRDLDEMTFYDYMRRQYGDKVARFSDQYSRSLFGVGARSVSALAGLVFFSADFSDSENVTWPQGPSAISEKLAARIGQGNIRTGALVTAVRPASDGVEVSYEKDGKTHLVRAKAVIMALPSFIDKKIVLGLPAWKRRALEKVRYSSYAIGVVALNKPVDVGAWDLWDAKPAIFTDLEPLDWPFRVPGRPAAPAQDGAPAQLLKLYMPMGENDGRHYLISATDDEISGRLVADLERLLPETRDRIHGVRVVRWGHAMPVDYPGYMTNVSAEVAKPAGRVLFAGVDSEMPCIEGAIVSGYRAAKQARALLAAAKPSAAAAASARP